MITISLKRRQDKDPVAGQKISLEFTHPATGWTKVRSTDACGNVSFPIASGEATLFINGGPYFSGWLSEHITVFMDCAAYLPQGISPAPLQAETSDIDAPALEWETWE